jgi:hypothetical protein
LAALSDPKGEITKFEFLTAVQVTPSWGWILMYEYSICFFLLLYGKYLHIAWASGQGHGRGGYGLPYSKVRHQTLLHGDF